jgi:hypothetical protein
MADRNSLMSIRFGGLVRTLLLLLLLFLVVVVVVACNGGVGMDAVDNFLT